jgi:hypothetical protein
VHVRHSCRQLLSISEQQDAKLFFQQPTIVFISPSHYQAFFEQLLNETLSSVPSRQFMKATLSGILDGAIHTPQRNGLNHRAITFKYFFDSLFKLIIEAEVEDKRLLLLLELLEQNAEEWNLLDTIFKNIYPRDSFILFCHKQSQFEGESRLLKSLLLLNKYSMDIQRMVFPFSSVMYRDTRNLITMSNISNHYTLLHIALWNRDLDCIKGLLEHGIFNVDTVDGCNRTILQYSIVDDMLIHIAEWLITETEASGLQEDISQITPIQLAYLYQRDNLLKLFEHKYGLETIDNLINQSTTRITNTKLPDLEFNKITDAIKEAKEQEYDYDSDYYIEDDEEFAPFVHTIADFKKMDQNRLETENSTNYNRCRAYGEVYLRHNPDADINDSLPGYDYDLRPLTNFTYGYDLSEEIEDYYEKYINDYHQAATENGGYYSDDGHLSDSDDEEEGISTSWIMSTDTNHIRKVVQEFEVHELDHWNEDDGMYMRDVTKVVERTPLATLSYSLGKRKRESTEISSVEDIHHANKKQRIEDLKAAITYQYQHELRRLPLTRLLLEIASDYKTDIAFTPLARFILHNAAEDRILKNFEYASDVSQYHKRDYVIANDLQYERHNRAICTSVQDNSSNYLSESDSEDEDYVPSDTDSEDEEN